MRITHEPFMATGGRQYFIDTFFALAPTLLNTGGVFPAFAWLCRYWQTYPVDAQGNPVEMYRTTYKSDPRGAKP